MSSEEIERLAMLVHQDILNKGGGYSFVEMERCLSPHIEVKGDRMIVNDNNYVLWQGVSSRFVEIFQHLESNQFVELRRSDLLVYALDGRILDMPIAKRVSKQGYKTPHWLVATMYPCPCQHKKRARV